MTRKPSQRIVHEHVLSARGSVELRRIDLEVICSWLVPQDWVPSGNGWRSATPGYRALDDRGVEWLCDEDGPTTAPGEPHRWHSADGRIAWQASTTGVPSVSIGAASTDRDEDGHRELPAA